MEELGIGRPSTYASIISVLQDRNYVRLDRRRFVPEDRGRLVTAFLTSFFRRYVDTGFTASLEERLDDISGGRADWREVMAAFWADFSKAVAETKELSISDVINALDADLGPHFFPAREDGSDPRLCPSCGQGRLGLKLGRLGAFIGCSHYPACQYTRPLAVAGAEGEDAAQASGTRELGRDPATGGAVTLRRGPYELYVQAGEAVAGEAKGKAKGTGKGKGKGKGKDDAKEAAKPRRASLPRGMEADTVTLEQACALLALPRAIGAHPETGQMIEAGIGRFGPYVRMGSVYASLDRDDDVLAVGLNRAVDLLAKKLASVRSLGPHPKDGAEVTLRKGRFGPYARHGDIVANLPRGVAMEEVTLDQALGLLAEKGKPLKPRGAKGRPARGAAKSAAAEAPKAAKVVKLTPKAKKPAARKKARKAAKPAPKRAAG
jgi:DNA topoisomerase-1